MMIRIVSMCLVLLSSSLFAAIDTFEFNNDEDRQRFRQLSEELRCPKCQNQNLAGSDAAIALDLRAQIYRMIGEGRTNAEIKGFMVERYGDFVLYKPTVNPMTYVLWYGPFGLLFLGFMVVFIISKQKANKKTDHTLRDEQAEHEKRLQELLDNKK